jgi:hypothetical protein
MRTTRSIRSNAKARPAQLRARVLKAFRARASGTDARAAHAQTMAFHRSSGLDWARCLS